MKPRCLLLCLLLLGALAAAAQDDLDSFDKGIIDTLKKEGKAFQDVGVAAGGVPGGFKSAFDSFQPGYCGDDWRLGGADLVIGPWIQPTLVTLILVTFVIAIIYMMGHLLQLPQLIAMAKDEWHHMIMLALMLAFIVGLLTGAQAWYRMRGGFGSTDPIYANNPIFIDAAMAVCRKMIVDMVSDYGMLVLYNMIIHTLYSSTMWFGVTWRAMYSFNLGPVLKPLIDILGMAMQYLGLGISEWMLHLITLCMVKRWSWGFFIPVGILLRAIPWTRGAGAALLALFFALTLFYPFMFLMDYEVNKIMQYNLVSGTSVLENFAQKSGFLGITGSALAIMLLAAGVFIPFFLGAGLSVAFQLIKNAVYYIVIMSLLMPFLNIFVTLTAAKEIARAWNVDVSFMSFIKII